MSFSVLLGLVPDWRPVLLLAACFLFFSLILVVDSHYYRTLVAFTAFPAGACLSGCGHDDIRLAFIQILLQRPGRFSLKQVDRGMMGQMLLQFRVGFPEFVHHAEQPRDGPFTAFPAGACLSGLPPMLTAGCLLLSLCVLTNLALKHREAGILEVHLLWKH